MECMDHDSFVGERAGLRPQYIFACQGSLTESYREWTGEKRGGGCSLTAKQEVAQHLFFGIQKETQWPAVCLKEF